MLWKEVIVYSSFEVLENSIEFQLKTIMKDLEKCKPRRRNFGVNDSLSNQQNYQWKYTHLAKHISKRKARLIQWGSKVSATNKLFRIYFPVQNCWTVQICQRQPRQLVKFKGPQFQDGCNACCWKNCIDYINIFLIDKPDCQDKY